MNIRSISKLSLSCGLIAGLSGCLGGDVEHSKVAEPIYADQTYTKTGTPVHANGADTDQTGLAGCQRGLGTIQRGSLVCPGY